MKNKQSHSLPMFTQPGEDLIKCLKSSKLTEVTTVSKKRAQWTETKLELQLKSIMGIISWSMFRQQDV